MAIISNLPTDMTNKKVINIEKGGTGATTAEQALINLGLNTVVDNINDLQTSVNNSIGTIVTKLGKVNDKRWIPCDGSYVNASDAPDFITQNRRFLPADFSRALTLGIEGLLKLWVFGGVWYGSASTGLYISTDRGMTWDLVTATTTGIQDIALMTNGNLVISCQSGNYIVIYVYDPITGVATDVYKDSGGSTSIAVSSQRLATNGEICIITASVGGSDNPYYISTNSGTLWTNISFSSGGAATKKATNIKYIRDRFWGIRHTSISGSNYYASIAYSFDGLNWTVLDPVIDTNTKDYSWESTYYEYLYDSEYLYLIGNGYLLKSNNNFATKEVYTHEKLKKFRSAYIVDGVLYASDTDGYGFCFDVTSGLKFIGEHGTAPTSTITDPIWLNLSEDGKLINRFSPFYYHNLNELMTPEIANAYIKIK